jgi:protein CsiD
MIEIQVVLLFSPEKNTNSKLDDVFLVKLSTADNTSNWNTQITTAMAGKFYARFHVKHEDKSDSYLRKAYTNLDLHTDGTYVKEITDWLMMTKIRRKEC